MTTLFSLDVALSVCNRKPRHITPYFFLRGKKNALQHLKAYGSDEEVSLLNASIAAFPDAIGLRCFIHMKDNIENYL